MDIDIFSNMEGWANAVRAGKSTPPCSRKTKNDNFIYPTAKII